MHLVYKNQVPLKIPLKPERPQLIKREYDAAKKEWKIVPNNEYPQEVYISIKVNAKFWINQCYCNSSKNILRQDMKREYINS
jgi:hypothetical protein